MPARVRRPRKALFLLALALLIGGVAAFALWRDRTPTWVAIDRAQWNTALEQLGRTYTSTAKASAARTNDAAARALADSVAHSQRIALASGAQPIPPRIREALEEHFPDDVLDDVRWSLAGERVDLGSALARWAVKEGAVTMGDVVVFSREQGTRSLALWAHELTHVVQYRELGVRDFARLYVTNWRLLEERARINAGEVLRAIREKAEADRLSEEAEAARQADETEADRLAEEAEVDQPREAAQAE